MKSISAKFLTLIIGCLCLTCVGVGGAGIYTSRSVINQDSTNIMNLLCTREAQVLNTKLAYVEQSVNTLATYTDALASNAVELKNDHTHVTTLVTNIEVAALNIARSTNEAVSVYFRLNPKLYPPTAGFFLTKSENGLTRYPTTDLSRFSPSQADYVGWYHIPVNNKRPTWLNPYQNKNTDTWMISYVIPIYVDGDLLGVVGMDIDYATLTKSVEQAHVYESGYAFLATSDGRVVYHKDLPMHTILSPNPDSELNGLTKRLLHRTDTTRLFSYTYKGEHKRMTFQDLHNGMKFVLTSPVKEIDAKFDELLRRIAMISLIILGIAVIWTYVVTKKLVGPLRELDAAARKIAAGDLSVHITHQSNDEVGTLAESFRQTTTKLKQYINHINSLAYRDALTGCKNSAAYMEIQARINEQIQSGAARFGVLMFDLNDLKIVNDTRGHNFGDIMIASAGKIICEVFKHSPVYRIGGDEFTAVLESTDLDRAQELIEQLTPAMLVWNRENREHDLHMSMSWGLAVYSLLEDKTFQDVSKRADNIMYKHKAFLKQGRVRQVWNTAL